MRAALRRVLSTSAATALVATGLATLAPPARAATSTTTFAFTGSTSQDKTLYDSGLIYIDGCSHGDLAINPDDPTSCFPDDFPGTFWGHLHVGIRTTVVRAAAGDLTLERPDTFRQDATSTFITTFVAKDAAGKEVTVTTEPFVQFQAAYDAPLANCPKSRIPDVAALETFIDTAPASECLNLYGDTGELSLGEFTLLAQDTTLPYAGSKTVSQTAESPELEILPGLLGLKLAFVTDLVLQATAGYNATRTLAASSAPGTPLSTATLSWPDANQHSEDVTLPCSVPAGDDLLYRLSDVQWGGQGDVDVSVHPVLVFIGIFDVTLPGPSVSIFEAGDLTSTAPPWQQTLGAVLAENKAPTVGVGTLPSGPEGTPLTFAAVGTGPGGSFDNCDASGAGLDFVWTFDDGAQAFGPAVSHAFADNNGASARSGRLVVTDPAGNATTRNFSVAVSNAAPAVSAGPDTSAAWGRQVAFAGAATDPGSADQSTLTYSWSFGDGSPSASGGAATTHSYATPGTYTAAFTVTDKDGGTTTDQREVVVRKRTTSTSYTGDHSGTYATATSLAASLVDEYGAAVPGRSVAFVVAGEAAGVALTNGSGAASKSWVLGVGAPGSGTVSAAFDGTADPLYDSSGTSVAYGLSVKATSTTYTGALKSQPNKVVSLSAVLKDASGIPLVGKVVTFTLGTQSVTSGTSSAGGVVTATLKLTQKNGTKSLVTSFAGDAGFYAPSSASSTFKIG
jgi:PKD domain